LANRTNEYIKRGLIPLSCPKCGQVISGWSSVDTLTGDYGSDTFTHTCPVAQEMEGYDYDNY